MSFSISLSNELNAISTIAQRDIIKFFRDKIRLIFSIVFPIIFVGIIGGMLHQNIGNKLGYNFQKFVFFGVIVQTLFQSTVSGLVSLIRDREHDFTQEMFVAPISRFSIILGKIVGSGTISLLSVLGIIVFGLIDGVPLSWNDIFLFAPIALISCLLGGAFGLLILGNISNPETANFLFPFVIFPQMFVAGVLSPIKNSGIFLSIISHIAPLTYLIDFSRGLLYWGQSDYNKLVLYHPLFNLGIICAMFFVFVIIGTLAFARNEKNK
jgi:ABC-2 type transport system permease protein